MTELTPSEILRGKLLSPETSALLQSEVSRFTETLTTITFSADPVERETAILFYVEAQAKRNALLALLEDSVNTYQQLSELETSPRN